MRGLLAQLVLTSLAIAAPATALLFVGSARRPPLRAWVRAGVVALVLGLLTGGAGVLIGAPAGRSAGVAAVVAAAVLACGRVAAPWTARGLVAWAATIVAGAAYLGYVLVWTATADLSVSSRASSSVLWLLELFVYVLALGYVWELVDVLARWDWRRRVQLRQQVADPAAVRPFVSLHVPTHNEPPDLVLATLQRLLELEYDDYEVLVLDNNTTDPALWRPVEAFCAGHARLRFFHLDDWPGFKSGALNFGLEQVDPRTALVGVIDADYQVEPDFLARCAPLFADPALAFVQTPQDYRDWNTDPYFRRLYHSYGYFFDVSQRSRNERGGAIFGGTMGLIRRAALEQVGRWDEWCITEDAELSLRLLKAGWSGTHVEESFGRGIMPLTFEALKRQRFRWCFGGVQILRMHWRALLPGRRTDANQLTWSQRWAYLVGGLQWFGDLVGLLFSGFLLLGAANLVWGDGVTVRRFAGPILVGVVGLIVLGMLRSLALIRRTSGATWRESLGALGLWLGLGWAVSLGSVRGLLAREGVFLRTPKTRGEMGWRDALRGNRVESLLGVVCLAGAVAAASALAGGATLGAAVVLGLLLLQGAGYFSAPLNSLAAINADLTPELRRRRREAMLSWTRVAPGIRRWGLAPVVAAVGAGALLVLLAAPVGGPVLERLPIEAVRKHPASPVPTPRGKVRPGVVVPTRDATVGTTTSPVPTAGSSPAAGPTQGPSATSTPTVTSQPTPTTQPTPTRQPTPTTQPTPTSHPTPTGHPTPTSSPTTHPTGRP